MSKRMTVVFKDENIYMHLKVEAAKRNINASDIVSEAVGEWIESREDFELSPLIRSSQEELKLKPGQKLQVIQAEDRVEYIILKDIKDARGFLKGMNTDILREEDRI